jgi:hypothetical protein
LTESAQYLHRSCEIFEAESGVRLSVEVLLRFDNRALGNRVQLIFGDVFTDLK